MYRDRVSIKGLKDFAFARLPKDSPLRDIILAESETVDTATFLARLPIWLKLSVHIRENSRQTENAICGEESARALRNLLSEIPPNR